MKMLTININQSAFIIRKHGPSITNTRSSFTYFIVYFCTLLNFIFLNYYPRYKHFNNWETTRSNFELLIRQSIGIRHINVSKKIIY